MDEADPKSGVEIDFRSLGEDFLPTDSSPDQKTEDLFYIGGLHSESESEFLSSMEQFRGNKLFDSHLLAATHSFIINSKSRSCRKL